MSPWEDPVYQQPVHWVFLCPPLERSLDKSPVFFIRHNHVRYAFPQHLFLVADNYSNNSRSE